MALWTGHLDTPWPMADRIGILHQSSFIGTESLCQLDLGSHSSFLSTQPHLFPVDCHLARQKGLECVEPNSEVLVLVQPPPSCMILGKLLSL